MAILDSVLVKKFQKDDLTTIRDWLIDRVGGLYWIGALRLGIILNSVNAGATQIHLNQETRHTRLGRNLQDGDKIRVGADAATVAGIDLTGRVITLDAPGLAHSHAARTVVYLDDGPWTVQEFYREDDFLWVVLTEQRGQARVEDYSLAVFTEDEAGLAMFTEWAQQRAEVNFSLHKLHHYEDRIYALARQLP